jgi:hypothetical protein
MLPTTPSCHIPDLDLTADAVRLGTPCPGMRDPGMARSKGDDSKTPSPASPEEDKEWAGSDSSERPQSREPELEPEPEPELEDDKEEDEPSCRQKSSHFASTSSVECLE